MLVKTEGIIFQNIKYADKKSILKIYTKDYGLVTCNAIISSAKSSKTKPAFVSPLSQVEICFTNKQNRDVQQLTDIRLLTVYKNIHLNYNKLAISQFLIEVLNKCIKEENGNIKMFDFICETFNTLDNCEKEVSNFHIYFLFDLCHYLGINPLNNYSIQSCFFNTLEGRFSESALSFPMGFNQAQSNLFLRLFPEFRKEEVFKKNEKTELLDCLIAYYKMQISGFSDLKSYQVLKEMFNN